MATAKLPRYTRSKKLKGAEAYFWEPPTWARPTKDPVTHKSVPRLRAGRACPVTAEALGTDLSRAIAKAEVLNEGLDAWREGKTPELVPGTVKWLFDWYRRQDRYTKNVAKTRHDYLLIMNRLVDEKMKVGTLGQRKASAVNATAADTVYKRWKTKHGVRQATYAMQVCRLVWNWAKRHKDVTGVTENPFSGMGLVSTAAEGNRPTSRDEYDLYRDKARELGWQSMATAAAIGFELCQRVWDVFGIEDPDGRKHRGFLWDDYKPGIEIAYRQSKGGKAMRVPLSEEIEGERIALFPDLEAELALTQRLADTIVVDEKTGAPLTYDQMNKRHRKICDKAGLPRAMTFTGFRHGGSTELGDAGVDDIRPITGHLQLNTTAIYNKISRTKAVAAARLRKEYVARIAAAQDGDSA